MQTSYDNGTDGTIRDRDNNWPIGGRKKNEDDAMPRENTVL